MALLVLGVSTWLLSPAPSPRINSASCAEPDQPHAEPVASLPDVVSEPDPCAPPRELGKDLRGVDPSTNRYGLPDPGRMPPPTTIKPAVPDDSEVESPFPNVKSTDSVVGPGPGPPQRIVEPVDDGCGPWPLAGTKAKPATPALRWLVDRQAKEGYWGANDVAESPNGEALRGSVFTTAMALLANLRTAASHRDGDTRSTVRAAILWVRKIQEKDGNLASTVADEPLLHHAAATLAIAEAWGNTGDGVLKPLTDKAIQYLLKSRSSLGGWGMKAGDLNPNVTATGWALFALQRAKQAGLDVDQEVLNDAALWAWSLRRNGYIAWSSYQDVRAIGTPAPDDTTIADAVFLCALKWGGYQLAGESSAIAAQDRLLNGRPAWDGTTNDLMAWMFTGVALHATVTTSAEDWKENVLQQVNNAAVIEAGEDGKERASWTSTDYWSQRFGMDYTTALASILQTDCAPPAHDETK